MSGGNPPRRVTLLLVGFAMMALMAVPGRVGRIRVPVELGIVVGVEIHNTRSNDPTLSVNGPLCRAGNMAERRDTAIVNTDITAIAGHACPVDDCASTD
jgi:hypothetical protein